MDKRVGKNKERDANKFLGEYPRRIYAAVPEKVWINGDGDIKGEYINVRMEIDLLNK